MPDHDDRLAALEGDGADVLRQRPGSQAVVDGRLAEAHCGRGLPRPQQRARDDGVGDEPVRAQAVAEPSCLGTALLRQRAQLVGIARRRFGGSNDHDARPGQDKLAAMVVTGERYRLLVVATASATVRHNLGSASLAGWRASGTSSWMSSRASLSKATSSRSSRTRATFP